MDREVGRREIQIQSIVNSRETGHAEMIRTHLPFERAGELIAVKI